MRFLTPSTLLSAALLSGCGSPTPAPKAGSMPVALNPVTVAQLNDFIADQKGKVILMDCWFLN